MSRDDGFRIADVDVTYLDDDKVRRLWHQLRDQARVAQAILIHEATFLASWKTGSRVPVSAAMPVWFVADPELVVELQRAHLLDATERIPVRSWRVWFGPARARKIARQEAGRVGGLASGKSRRTPKERLPKQSLSGAEATVNPSGPSGPDRPLRPSGPSSPRARARDDVPSSGTDGRGRLAELVSPEALTAIGKLP